MATEGSDASGRGHQASTKVFFSYSRKNMAFVDRLEPAIRDQGIEPLIDRHAIYAFEDWWKRIEALIAQADTVVFVLSPEAVASEVCEKEVAFAATLNKRLAPIVCQRVSEAAIPGALRSLNFIFFDDEATFKQSVLKLVEALHTDIAWIRKHTEFGEHARRWTIAGRPGPRGLLLRSPALEEAEQWIALRPPGAPLPTAETQAFIAQSRRAATRRRNTISGALASGLLVTLSLTALAYWQRNIAVEQRQLADEQRRSAELQRSLAEEQRGIADEKTREAQQQSELAAKAAVEADKQRDAASKAAAEADSQRKQAESSATSARRAQGQAEEERTKSEAARQEATQNQIAAVTALARAERPMDPIRALKLSLAAWPRNVADWKGPPSVLEFALREISNSVVEVRHKRIFHWVQRVSFSPNSQRIVVQSNSGASIQDWKELLEKPQEFFSDRFRHEGIMGASLSPKDDRIVTAGADGTAIVWNDLSGSRQGSVSLRGHSGQINDVTFSPDGNWILTASADKTARIWNPLNGQETTAFKGHTDAVLTAAFSADGSRVITASKDGTARVWDVAGKKRPLVLGGHNGEVWSAAFSPDQTKIITASSDQTAVAWDAASGKRIAPLVGHTDAVTDAAFSPDGKRVVTASEDKTARMWDATTWQPITVYKGHLRAVKSAAFSPDANFVVTGSADGTARVWDANRLGPTVTFGLPDRPHAVQFSPDGTKLLTVPDVGVATVWDASSGQLAVTLEDGNVLLPISWAYSPRGGMIAIASNPDRVTVWNARSGKTILNGSSTRPIRYLFFPPGETCTSIGLCFPSDIHMIAIEFDHTSGRDIIVVRDAETSNVVKSTPISELPRNIGQSIQSSPSKDGKRLLIFDGFLATIDVETGKAIAIKPYDDKVRTARLSPDGTRIVTTFDDGTVRLLDASTMQPVAVLQMPERDDARALVNAEFSPDGTRILTSGRRVRIWDIESRSPIAVFGDAGWASYSPDGRRIFLRAQGKIQVWEAGDLGAGNIFDIACSKLPDDDVKSIERDFGLAALTLPCDFQVEGPPRAIDARKLLPSNIFPR